MNHLARKIIILILLAVSPLASKGFDADTYASSSVLADGRWVKISVTETGMHLISNTDLRSMGFTSPEKVRVYGYGGRRIPDYFSRANYIDDLPLVQSVLTSRGIVFYAVGLETREDVSGSPYYFHSLNPYATAGYYFLTDKDIPQRQFREEGLAPGPGLTSTFIESSRHEIDATSPAESGHLLLGEDFRLTRNRTFNFQLPGRVADSDVWIQADFFGKTNSLPASFRISANGYQLPYNPNDRIRPTSEFGDSCRIRKTFQLDASSLSLGIECTYSGSVSVIALDNISVCYERSISLPSSKVLTFTTSGISPMLSGATADTRVWDVTDPLDIISVKTTQVNGGVAWTSEYYGQRTYAVWDPSGSFASPLRAGNVANQDIHGRTTPDMVIISHPDLVTQSERIADLHREGSDHMDVLVITPEKVYNEFGSGTPDINALRRMLKMFYDRGTSADGHSLKYMLLMGAATFDHRCLTEAVSRSNGTYVPTWQTDGSLSDDTSFSSDDYYAFLDDDSGMRPDRDKLRIAVGRIPARNPSAAKVFTDRLISYSKSPLTGDWKSKVLLMADDGDIAVHLDQTESLEKSMRQNHMGENLAYNKVYLDAHEKLGGVAVNARNKLHTLLNDGVIWWNYIGHASLRELSGEGVMVLKDLNTLYLKRPAFFYGATCSFLHWDGTELSGLEMLAMSDAGGVIGGISAVRPVFITRNGVLSSAMGSELFARGEDGRIRTVAEAMRRAKNRVDDTNRLRYVFLGDPAMRLAVPSGIVRLSDIGGAPAGDIDNNPVTIPSLAPTVMKGVVTDFMGNVMTEFNGYVSLTIYDAERSVTTFGRDDKTGIEEEAVRVFEEQGDRIYAGRATVTNGQWECRVILPAEIADNYRPAALLMYAESEDATITAGGTDRSFYVYGMADDAITDDKAPIIEQLYLNHETFENGETVNTAPMLIARITDDNGFNLSTSGIGHMMSVRIDGTMNLTDVSESFTPDADGSPRGMIHYQLPELSPGNHTATLMVWDVAGNSASSSVEFFTDPSAAPKIFDMYSDANPATVDANFYVIHNRPDAMLQVKIEIFDINGTRIWTNTTSGRADMYSSSPVNWNLTNSHGNRVGRGIYLYRATVTTEENGTTSTMTRRIAVSPL